MALQELADTTVPVTRQDGLGGHLTAAVTSISEAIGGCATDAVAACQWWRPGP